MQGVFALNVHMAQQMRFIAWDQHIFEFDIEHLWSRLCSELLVVLSFLLLWALSVPCNLLLFTGCRSFSWSTMLIKGSWGSDSI